MTTEAVESIRRMALDVSSPTTPRAAPREPLLVERQSTHGSFRDNAMMSQSLKRMFCGTEHYATLCDEHREALDMIALKISRVLSGQANFKDHWDDIAGYAKLGSEACD